MLQLCRMSEIVHIYNDKGEVVGSLERNEAEDNNHVIANVIVFVFNSQGHVWVQKRPADKKHFPNMWDVSACGGIESHETPLQAATRETNEETGLLVDLVHVETFVNEFADDSAEYTRLSHVFIGQSEDTPILSDEVAEFAVWEPSELRTHASANPAQYIPSFVVELDIATKARQTT